MIQTQPEALNLEEFRAKVTRAAREPLLVRIAELEEINTQLCEQADVAAAAYADLQAQLVKEAARTAEEKLRADQMSKQHDMQAKMHQEAVRKLTTNPAAAPAGYVALAALTSRTHADDYAKCFATEAALLENYPAAKAIAVFDHATQPVAPGWKPVP